MNESQPYAQRSLCQVAEALRKLYQWQMDTLQQGPLGELTETESKEYLHRRKRIGEEMAQHPPGMALKYVFLTHCGVSRKDQSV